MSGFEIAGFVVGALPVCASALEEVGKVADGFKRFSQWHLKLPRYVDRLEEEGIALVVLLRWLCRTVGEDLDVRAIGLRDSAQLWPSEELTQKLRTKYGQAYDYTERKLRGIGEHVNHLSQELGLGAITEPAFPLVPLTGYQSRQTSLRDNLRRRINFAISRKIVETRISEIQRIRADIKSTLKTSLESTSSEAHVLQHLRAKAKLLHSTISNSFVCTKHAHYVKLLLEPRSFRTETECFSQHKIGHDIYRVCVAGVELDSYECAEIQVLDTTVPPTSIDPRRSEPMLVGDLCAALQVKCSNPAEPPRFRINGKCNSPIRSRDSILCHASQDPGFTSCSPFDSIRTLRDELSCSPKTTDEALAFTNVQRRYLAFVLTINALQLLATPWMGASWGRDHISFACPNFSPDSAANDFTYAFAHHTFPGATNSHWPMSNEGSHISDLASHNTRIGLLRIGMILLELLLGEKLSVHQDVSKISGVKNPEYLSALLGLECCFDEQKNNLSRPYRNALIECRLLAADPRLNLDQENWLEAAFVKIVAPLRDEYLSSVTAL